MEFLYRNIVNYLYQRVNFDSVFLSLNDHFGFWHTQGEIAHLKSKETRERKSAL